MMPNGVNWVIQLLFQGKDQTGPATKSAAGGLDKLAKATSNLIAGYLTLQTAQKALEFVKFGAQVDQSARALDNLAKSAGTSGKEIIASIQKASQYTIDSMTAMQVANRAMMMGVAESPAEFARLTEVAVRLGRAMGKDAASSIDDFVTAAGRQSVLIADNLGLMVKVESSQEHYAQKLGKTADQLTETEKKQAFLNEMLDQGEIKVSKLGDATLGAAEKIGQMDAILKTTSQTFAASFSKELLAGEADVTQLGETTERWAPRIGKALAQAIKMQLELAGISPAIQQLIEDEEQHQTRLQTTAREMERLANTVAWTTDEERRLDEAMRAGATGVDRQKTAFVEVGESAYNYGDSLDELIDREGDAASSVAFQKHLEDIDQAARDARATLMDMAADYTDYQRDIADDAKDYATDLEKIEQEHQDNLADIQKKGQSYSIKIDELAELEKLEDLRYRLGVLYQQQSEFTDKTRESSRMLKTKQIEDTQEKIAAQEKLLDDYYNGRLVKQGQNVSGLLAEEQKRYDEEKRLLEESRAEQEAEQRRSLGQMLINNMVAWAELHNVSGDEIFAMRLKISEEYGIITTEGKTAAEKQAAYWKASFSNTLQELGPFTQEFMRKLNEIPSTKTVTVRYNYQTGQAESGYSGGSAPGMQHGGRSSGGMTWVGERGAELVRLPPGSHVYNAQQSRTINNHYNLSVSSMQQSRGIALDFATLRAMGG